MKAMFLKKACNLDSDTRPLEQVEIPQPVPARSEILIKVSCCAVCHTELDEIEGRLEPSFYPVIPGHQVVGYVVSGGENTGRFHAGDRVGVSWIYSACGICEYCLGGYENLCPEFKATGKDVHGGYAEYMIVPEKYAYPIPPVYSDAEAAPLLCAGAIGYRSLRLSGIKNGETLGLSGFGASGHLVLKMAAYLFPDTDILVFTRNPEERAFALSLGALWAGSIDTIPPSEPAAIIDTTPVWQTVLKSLEYLRAGGRLVINVIRKEERDKNILAGISYSDHLWMEKEIKTVANITRRDVEEFLKLAALMHLKPEIKIYPLEEANAALLDLKHKHIKGAKVLQVV